MDEIYLLLLFSRSVVADSLRPHGLQHPRLPCPSPSPRVFSNLCPSSRLCHPTTSSSVVPFFSCLNLVQHQSFFNWVSSSLIWWPSIGASTSASVLPMNVQDWFPLQLPGLISMQSKGLSRVFSNTKIWKHQFFGAEPSLWSNSHICTTGKTIALTIWMLVGKVTSLLFNMLSRFVIAFLPRSKRLLISWLESPSEVILELKKIKSLAVSIVSPSICHEMIGPDAMIFVFWMLSFKPVIPLYSFTFIKRLFSYSSAIRVVSSAYLRLLIFLLAVLIPACDSSCSAFLMMYSAYKLNIQGGNIQPSCTPFSNFSLFIRFK